MTRAARRRSGPEAELVGVPGQDRVERAHAGPQRSLAAFQRLAAALRGPDPGGEAPGAR